jgi:hypothetical protein
MTDRPRKHLGHLVENCLRGLAWFLRRAGRFALVLDVFGITKRPGIREYVDL